MSKAAKAFDYELAAEGDDGDELSAGERRNKNAGKQQKRVVFCEQESDSLTVGKLGGSKSGSSRRKQGQPIVLSTSQQDSAVGELGGSSWRSKGLPSLRKPQVTRMFSISVEAHVNR